MNHLTHYLPIRLPPDPTFLVGFDLSKGVLPFVRVDLPLALSPDWTPALTREVFRLLSFLSGFGLTSCLFAFLGAFTALTALVAMRLLFCGLGLLVFFQAFPDHFRSRR